MSNGVERFIDENKKVSSWPKKHADKDLVLAYLITRFDFNVTYNELEVNEVLKQWHTFSDWPLLRRELFERDYFDHPSYMLLYGAYVNELFDFIPNEEASERIELTREDFIRQYEAGSKKLMAIAVENAWRQLSEG